MHLVTLQSCFCLVSCLPLQRNGVQDQSLHLVTSSRSALIRRALDQLFVYGEKALHKQEGAFWRQESQGVKYPPSYAALPSLSKGPSRKPEVGSIQAGRRVSQPLAFSSASSPVLPTHDPPVLGGMSLPGCLPHSPFRGSCGRGDRPRLGIRD